MTSSYENAQQLCIAAAVTLAYSSAFYLCYFLLQHRCVVRPAANGMEAAK